MSRINYTLENSCLKKLEKPTESSIYARKKFFNFLITLVGGFAAWKPSLYCHINQYKREIIHKNFKDLDVYKTFKKKMVYCRCTNLWKNLITNWKNCECVIDNEYVQYLYNLENGICACFYNNCRNSLEINCNNLYQKALHTFYHYIIQLMQDKKNDAKVIYLINQIMFKEFPFYSYYFLFLSYDEQLPVFGSDLSFVICIPHYDSTYFLKFLLLTIIFDKPRPKNIMLDDGHLVKKRYSSYIQKYGFSNQLFNKFASHKFTSIIGCTIEEYEIANPEKRFFWNKFENFSEKPTIVSIKPSSTKTSRKRKYGLLLDKSIENFQNDQQLQKKIRESICWTETEIKEQIEMAKLCIWDEF